MLEHISGSLKGFQDPVFIRGVVDRVNEIFGEVFHLPLFIGNWIRSSHGLTVDTMSIPCYSNEKTPNDRPRGVQSQISKLLNRPKPIKGKI